MIDYVGMVEQVLDKGYLFVTVNRFSRLVEAIIIYKKSQGTVETANGSLKEKITKTCADGKMN